MKIYYPKKHYSQNYRNYLFPLLRAYIGVGNLSDEDRESNYGIEKGVFVFVNKIEQADLVILTMSWNYYVKTDKLKLADCLINEAYRLNKNVWSANLGDVGIIIPDYTNLIVYRSGGYFSKLPSNHKGMPVFISPPEKLISNYCFNLRNYDIMPTVGFCGHAHKTIVGGLKVYLKVFIKNMLRRMGFNKQEMQEYIYAPYLRFQILKNLSKSDILLSNFIIRKKYRAGAKSRKERGLTSKEFYDNIEQSDYVLCIRGAGNFSARFYETLAMGRIPLYIHTDGLLPLNDVIDWKSHLVWVDYKNRKFIPTILERFHRNLNDDSFKKLQESNRELFNKKLTMKGFFSESYN